MFLVVVLDPVAAAAGIVDIAMTAESIERRMGETSQHSAAGCQGPLTLGLGCTGEATLRTRSKSRSCGSGWLEPVKSRERSHPILF